MVGRPRRHHLAFTKCVATNCRTNEEIRYPKLFSFPRHVERYKVWAEAAQNPKLSEKYKRYHLCARHFNKNQFRDADCTMLTYRALPSVNPENPPEHLSLLPPGFNPDNDETRPNESSKRLVKQVGNPPPQTTENQPLLKDTPPLPIATIECRYPSSPELVAMCESPIINDVVENYEDIPAPEHFNEVPPPPQVARTNVCRLCGHEKENVVAIFSEEGNRLYLLQKIQDCLPLMVIKDDGLPQKVCSTCVSKLQTCHNFVTSCCKAVVNILSSSGADPVWFEKKYFSRNVQLEHYDLNIETMQCEDDCREPLQSVDVNKDDNYARKRPSTTGSKDILREALQHANISHLDNKLINNSAEVLTNSDEELRAIDNLRKSWDVTTVDLTNEDDDFTTKLVMKSLQNDFPGKSPESEVFLCMLCYKKISGSKTFHPLHKKLPAQKYHESCSASGKLRTMIDLRKAVQGSRQDSSKALVLPPACKFCRKLFFSKLELIQHELLHPQAKLFICENSCRTYPQKSRFLYFCDVCGETMTHMCGAQVDQLLQGSFKCFTCEGCAKKFRSRLRF